MIISYHRITIHKKNNSSLLSSLKKNHSILDMNKTYKTTPNKP